MSGEDEGSSTVTVSVRLIKSFEYRTIKHVPYPNTPLGQTVGEFIAHVTSDITTRSGLPPPFKKHKYDTMKISHQPFGAKTSDPVINTNNDDMLILHSDKTLQESNIVNETEVSFFNLEEYREYQRTKPTQEVLSW